MACSAATIDHSWLAATDDSACSAADSWTRAALAVLPAWLRLAQNLRRLRDTRQTFPHLVCAGKYAVQFVIAAFAMLYALRVPFANVFFYGWDGFNFSQN